MRMRQFVFVAADLEARTDDICAVLGLQTCYQDPGVGKFGLENYLIPIHGNLLEIVAPKEAGTTAGRFLERRGGDGGYMLILQCDDAVKERARITDMGIRAVWQNDSADAQATHFHPRDVPGAILSIDTMKPGEDWHQEQSYWKWAGPDWQRAIQTHRTQALAAVEMQSEDPKALAQTWSRVLGIDVAEGATEIPLDNMTLRFAGGTDGRGTGISAIDILPQNRDAIVQEAEKRGLKRGPNQIELCGVRVNLI